MTIERKQDRPVAVRLPPDLRKYMEQQARANFRSVSSEVAARVERTRQEDQAKQHSSPRDSDQQPTSGNS